MSQKQVVTRPGGTAKWQYDAATNDSDKTYTVPTGKIWEVLYIHVEIVATATVGNRYLSVYMANASPSTVWHSPNTTVITASQSGVLNLCGAGNNTTTPAQGTLLSGVSPNVTQVFDLPSLTLPAGYSIRCWERSAVDPAADDMIVVLRYIEYEA